MLCERLTDPRRLSDRRYIAEPKLDGQRAQLHVHKGEALACFSRRGLDLLRHPGMAWLRSIAWPFDSAIFDGEACAGDGHEGIQAVFTERNRIGGDMALVLFDVLHLDGKSVMREPWRDRRKRLEDLLDGQRIARVAAVPVTEDAAHLYETWVGMGGEGIVLKDPASRYRPGERSPAWLKVKPKLELDVIVTGGSAERIAWGDWGEAVMLELTYKHPRTGKHTQIRQAVRIARHEPFELRIRKRAHLVCWGVMPSGMLRHPLFLHWVHLPVSTNRTQSP
jgi:ATP-dependent DNA ligase